MHLKTPTIDIAPAKFHPYVKSKTQAHAFEFASCFCPYRLYPHDTLCTYGVKPWCFRGFADENSALLRYISPLPEKPLYSMPLQGIHYIPDWPVRVNVEHILGDPANVARLPTELQSARNLPLLLETAVELARRKVVVSPGDAVPQIYQQRLQYLLPLCLTDMEKPDLAITLRPMDGYYMGYTCLTLEMAYLNARLLARPTAKWLLDLVE